jgi:hypothetical protein
MIAHIKKPQWTFYPEWVLLNAVAVVIASVAAWNLIPLIANFVGDTIKVNGQTRITEDFLLGYMLFPAIGLLTGQAQYVLLRRHISPLRWWIAATVLGWLSPFLVGFILTPVIESGSETFRVWGIIGMPLIGAFMGLPQWWILRRAVRHAYGWLLAYGLAWGMIGWLNFLSTGPYAVISSIALIPALVTGIACWLLLDRLPNHHATLVIP